MAVAIVIFHDKCDNIVHPKQLASVQCYGDMNAIEL